MEGFFRPSEELCKKLIALHGKRACNYLFTSTRVHDGDTPPLDLVQESVQEGLLKISGTMWRNEVINEANIVTKEIKVVAGSELEGYFLQRIRERLHLSFNERGNRLLADLIREIKVWLHDKGDRYQFLSSKDEYGALVLRGEDIILETHGKMAEPVVPPLP